MYLFLKPSYLVYPVGMDSYLISSHYGHLVYILLRKFAVSFGRENTNFLFGNKIIAKVPSYGLSYRDGGYVIS